MRMNGNTILIIGGGTGIGYAMAKYFNKRKNTVLICGRKPDRLEQAAKDLPGLAFIPGFAAGMPLYSATKAGIHNFSISLRIQLAPLGIRVIEVIPPIMISELNIEGRKKRNILTLPYMMSANEYIEIVMVKMEQDVDEIRLEPHSNTKTNK